MNYGDPTGYKAYHEARGRTITDSDDVITQKLLAGSEWIDAMYGDRYQGTKVGQRDQVLGWPRVGAVDRDGYAVGSTTVPTEIVNATYEAAFRSGNLFKDYTPGKYSRVVITGSIDVTYRDVDAMDLQMQAPIIGAILDSLLGGSRTLSGLSGKVVRA